MTADHVSRIIANYEAGTVTEPSACLEILMAAGEGDADAILMQLPSSLRNVVIRAVVGANADKALILESSCSTKLSAGSDLRRREQIARRGILALQRAISTRRQ